MLIALDYDGTYTADPVLWEDFIDQAFQRGHRVIIATMRREEDEGDIVKRQLEHKVERIIFTARRAKKQDVRNQMGEDPTIWIDDNPDWLYEDAL